MPLVPWTVTAVRYLLRDRWLTVRADDCVTASGVSIAPYYVLEYADWAHAVLFNTQGDVFIIRQYRHGVGCVCAELPGGIIDAADTSPLEAVRREVREETGCEAARWARLSVTCPNPATHTNRLHAFVGYDAYIAAPPAPEAAEEIVGEFVPLPRLLAMIDDGTFCQAQQIGSLFLALRHAGRQDWHG